MPVQVTITGAVLRRTIGVLAVVGVLAAGGYGLFRLLRTDDPFAGGIDPDRYQAVVLSNDRVYFGRLRPAGPGFYELTDAVFLRETTPAEGAEPVQQVVPLTEELHGPESRMLINERFIVLVENLTEDSFVARAIEQLSARA